MFDPAPIAPPPLPQPAQPRPLPLRRSFVPCSPAVRKPLASRGWLRAAIVAGVLYASLFGVFSNVWLVRPKLFNDAALSNLTAAERPQPVTQIRVAESSRSKGVAGLMTGASHILGRGKRALQTAPPREPAVSTTAVPAGDASKRGESKSPNNSSAMKLAAVAARRPVSRRDPDAVAKGAVDNVLLAERDGSFEDRATRLQPVVQKAPDFAPARWQSGYVKVDGRWVSYGDSVARFAADRTLAEYRTLRAETPHTVSGQMTLANWCARNKLFAQRRAHLRAVVELKPDYKLARRMVGDVRKGPFWIPRRELKRQHDDARQATRDLKDWGPKIKAIRNDLLEGDSLHYVLALQELHAIDDPGAIQAVERQLAAHDPETAAIAIDYLGQQRSKESTLALAHQEMFSRWEAIRARAAEELKGRRYEEFVPQVLAMTSTPVQSDVQTGRDNQRSLFYRHTLSRETPNYKETGEITFNQNVLPIGNRQSGDAGRYAKRYATLAMQSRLQRARQFAAKQARLTADLQRDVAERNDRAQRLLSAVTGKAFGNDPRTWWSWWDDYTEATNYAKTERKPQVRREGYRVTYEPMPYVSWSSCLVAGTLVWTDRGPLAVETVQVGDRVLSQNVETGELAYKPVLKTTVRAPRPLLALEIGPQTIHLTGGHVFWIAGKGWRKAREVERGMLMHDLTGTTPVRSVGTAPPETTYNLIVADFHTYFVGQSKVLSHDNTPTEPTNARVPGLQPSRATGR